MASVPSASTRYVFPLSATLPQLSGARALQLAGIDRFRLAGGIDGCQRRRHGFADAQFWPLCLLRGPSGEELESDMKTTTPGRSGLHVSRIAFGIWQPGGQWGQFDASIRPSGPWDRLSDCCLKAVSSRCFDDRLCDMQHDPGADRT